MTTGSVEETVSVSSRNVEELSDSLKTFGALDYVVFAAMLVCCSAVGLYFGYQDHMKHKRSRRNRRGSIIEVEAIDYLMGGRNMKVFPVAMSLVASFVSGITLLGTSTEIYLYGTQYCYIAIAIILSALIMHFTIIPVFHELQITSTYEYLQRRFDKNVRLFGSIMFSLATILWLPIVIYVPALAFNQTTGINIHIITPLVMSICIFYTSLGGIKAVVWTDVIQMILMYGTLFLIVIKGTMNVGGLSVVIERNAASGRFEAPNFDFDPTVRHTFWTIVIGGTIFWVNTNGLNQNMIQRYMSLKDVRTARKGQMMYVIGVSFMIFLCCFNGLLLFATYHDCDPLTTKLAKAKDQLMPLLVMEILKDIPGLPGLFIAGVFSAALSSLSTGLNSMSCVILEDFCKPFVKREISESMSSLIMRGTVLVIGLLAVGLVYVVQHLGSVLQLSMSIPTACFGPMLGVYVIGFTLPWIGRRATLFAAMFACFSMMCLVFKAQAEIALGNINFETKPLTTEGCTYNFTLTSTLNATDVPHEENHEKHIWNISYLYYAPLGSSIVIITAFLLSFIFGFQDSSTVDSRLLAPFLRKYINSNESRKIQYMDASGKETVIHNFELKEDKNNVT
ncbi:hypothetical protein PVAND_010697 [Polypedilum vanderplanki]|uniref:Sodium/solute symporter n=1 Tax=Polypedilum vanderplanki TaxID=319348 RepID=A0A9J6CI45_POLVA|nr:hypothetical protein PVAND_010697 [Polypedilum vanderplanki]